MSKKIENICKRYETLSLDKTNFLAQWEDIATYVISRRANFLEKSTSGEKLGSLIYDNTATGAVDDLASALHGNMTNPAIPWFGLIVEGFEDDKTVDAWLEEVSKALMTVFNTSSNFQTAINEVYLDLVSLGTADMFSDIVDGNKIRFTPENPKNIVIAEDYQGRVETHYRLIQYTAAQIQERFPKATYSKGVQDALKDAKDLDKSFDILHLVAPYDERLHPKPKGLKKGQRAKYVSLYLEKEEKNLLTSGMYSTFPYAVPRWSKMTGEKYGRSPAMKAMGDIRTLNELVKLTLAAVDKAVDPPVQMPDEGFSSPINLGSRGTNFYDPAQQGRIEPIMSGANIPAGLEQKAQLVDSIRTAFYLDRLELPGGPQMTATEILERTQRQMQRMGPVTGRLSNELLKPIIDRTYDLMVQIDALEEDEEKRLLPEPPEVLDGVDFEIKYQSPLAKAQREFEFTSMQRLLSFIMPILEVSPEVGDKFDADKAVEIAVDILGVPGEVLNDNKTVKEIREQRAALQQQQMKMQMQMAQLDMAGKVKEIEGE